MWVGSLGERVFKDLTPLAKSYVLLKYPQTASLKTSYRQEAAYSEFILACLKIRSKMRRRLILHETKQIYSLNVFFTSSFIDVDTFYLFLNWFSTRISDDRKYVCGRRLYACINTRKFKGLDSREITSLPDIRKSDLHGTSFQSSPKINRMLIRRLICIQWKFPTPNHRNLANSDSYYFFDHSVVFTCSKVINAFKR